MSLSLFPYSNTVLWSAAGLLNKVHLAWRVYDSTKVYSNNLAPLLFGNILNSACDVLDRTMGSSHSFSKLPALPFLFGSLAIKLFEQLDSTNKAWQNFKYALSVSHPIHIEPSLKTSKRWTWIFILPFCSNCLTRCQMSSIAIERIASSAIHLIGETFQLLMRIMDLLELITTDEKKQKEILARGVQEIGIHLPECLKLLSLKKLWILENIKAIKPSLDHALAWSGTSSDQAIEQTTSFFISLDGCLKSYESFCKTTEKVVNTVISYQTNSEAKLFNPNESNIDLDNSSHSPYLSLY